MIIQSSFMYLPFEIGIGKKGVKRNGNNQDKRKIREALRLNAGSELK
jgi:hypothetical protein